MDLPQSNTQLLQLRRALEDGSAYPLAGRLEFSEVTVDRGTGAVTLRASFPNPDHWWSPSSPRTGA